jgi:hypothetical protein
MLRRVTYTEAKGTTYIVAICSDHPQLVRDSGAAP